MFVRHRVEVAAAKALDEAVSIGLLYGASIPAGRRPEDPAQARASSLRDHSDLYAWWDGPTPLDTWWRHAEVIDAPVTATVLRGRPLVRAVAAQEGLHVFAKDVTPEDVAPFGRVIRVVVPEAVPLSQRHAMRWLGTPRLVRALGGADPIEAEHPFA